MERMATYDEVYGSGGVSPDDETAHGYAPDYPSHVPDPVEESAPGLVWGDTLALRAPPWLDRGNIPADTLTLLSGMGGKGKSTYTASLAARATRGDLDGIYHGIPVNVLWVGNEDGRDEVVGPRLHVARADMARVAFQTLESESLGDEIDLVSDIDRLRELVEASVAKLVVIDPVVEYLPAGTDSHNDMKVRQALRPIRKLAQASRVAVVGICHLNKGDTLDVANRMMGSGAFRNAARSVLVVAEYAEREGWRVAFQNKSNAGPESRRGRLFKVEGVAYSDLQGRAVLDDRGEPATAGRILWGDVVEVNPDQLPAADTDRERPKLNRAAEMLMVLLTEGPQPRTYIEEQAKLEDLSWRTVQSAAYDEIGVVTEKHAGPDGGRAVSWWRLPECALRDSATAPPDCARSLPPPIEQSELRERAGQRDIDADCATKTGTQSDSAQSATGCEQCGTEPASLTIRGRLCAQCSDRVTKGDANAAAGDACIQPNCDQPRWSGEKRGQRIAFSAYCYEHANVSIFEAQRERADR